MHMRHEHTTDCFSRHSHQYDAERALEARELLLEDRKFFPTTFHDWHRLETGLVAGALAETLDQVVV